MTKTSWLQDQLTAEVSRDAAGAVWVGWHPVTHVVMIVYVDGAGGSLSVEGGEAGSLEDARQLVIELLEA